MNNMFRKRCTQLQGVILWAALSKITLCQHMPAIDRYTAASTLI